MLDSKDEAFHEKNPEFHLTVYKSKNDFLFGYELSLTLIGMRQGTFYALVLFGSDFVC